MAGWVPQYEYSQIHTPTLSTNPLKIAGVFPKTIKGHVLIEGDYKEERIIYVS